MTDSERDVVEDFEERAAIMEYDGNMPTDDAEREAVKVIFATANELTVEALKRDVQLLKAHLVTKGYGHNAIKRILAGEVVR